MPPTRTSFRPRRLDVVARLAEEAVVPLAVQSIVLDTSATSSSPQRRRAHRRPAASEPVVGKAAVQDLLLVGTVMSTLGLSLLR